MARHPFRVLWRLCFFLGVSLAALADFLLRESWRESGGVNHARRARWNRRWSPHFLRVLNLEVEFAGRPPAHGLLVCNHLSYVDVPLLGTSRPLIFVSKLEVRSWPVIGWLTRCAGTLFVDRNRRGDVTAVAAQFQTVIEAGLPVVIFPEGTSSDGGGVLPFRSSLLEPAAANGWPVSTAWIGYWLEDGSVGEEVCYWGDMTFFPHFLNLLSKQRVRARVAFGPALAPGLDRKELSRRLHAEVVRLGKEFAFPKSVSKSPTETVAATKP